jgi:hypothetical protein
MWPLYSDALTTPRFSVKEFNRTYKNILNVSLCQEAFLFKLKTAVSISENKN